MSSPRSTQRSLPTLSATNLNLLASNDSLDGQRYDCTAYQAITHTHLYLDSYQFGPGNSYEVGYRSDAKKGLNSVLANGTYQAEGNAILSTSGFLSNLHWHFVVAGYAEIDPQSFLYCHPGGGG